MGTDVEASIRVNRCVSCSNKATEFKSVAARREFGISGLCQECQDVAFAPPDEADARLYEDHVTGPVENPEYKGKYDPNEDYDQMAKDGDI